MFGRAVLVWVLIVPMAIANGMLRDLLLVPLLGDFAARAVSCITLSAAVLLVAWISLAWIGPPTMSAAWAVGVIWLALTLAFEFLAGHYLFGTSWQALRAEYNIVAGRLWIVVLITTLAATPLMFRAVHSPAADGKVSPAR
jgi:hypothetical protein